MPKVQLVKNMLPYFHVSHHSALLFSGQGLIRLHVWVFKYCVELKTWKSVWCTAITAYMEVFFPCIYRFNFALSTKTWHMQIKYLNCSSVIKQIFISRHSNTWVFCTVPPAQLKTLKHIQFTSLLHTEGNVAQNVAFISCFLFIFLYK